MSDQLVIDWTPASRSLGVALRRRESKAQAILARLQLGPATSYDLARITHRFSARLLELRRAGYHISREDRIEDGREWSIYTLDAR